MYKTSGKLQSPQDSTLRARLIGMQETLKTMISVIRATRKDVKDYSEQIKDWRKGETGISTRERNEELRKTGGYGKERCSTVGLKKR